VSDSTVKFLIPAALLLHGLGHVGALGALVALGHGMSGGPWLPARSWLIPSFGVRAATLVASIFWIVSAIGFVAASLSFWGVLVPGGVWRHLAAASSIVSLLGITLFVGTWPAFNTLAALAMNIAVLVTQLGLQWPPPATFGK
jgi:hypothetical protein